VDFYAKRFSLCLFFTLQAPPWVPRAVVAGFAGLPGDAAVVLADRKGFGMLPLPKWGASPWGLR